MPIIICMDAHQIEQLISQAITSRPCVTSAPLNLYILNAKLLCGARIVMPKNARFIAHISPETIANGFDENQWKAIVEKTLCIFNEHTENTTDNGFKERRREERLKITGSVYFDTDKKEKTLQGQMVDVSSGGMAFMCLNKPGRIEPGRQITARFSVPFFTPDGIFARRKFTRTAKICRSDTARGNLKQIAVQFAEPLPFKPSEQSQPADTNITVCSAGQI
ncbi:MAG: PilZ domain-containing protein [Phycisphaerae bacterium]